MNKTALILGVTGQDGSYLADLLLQKGYYVVGVARRSSTDTSGRLCLAKQNDQFQLVEGDVTDPLCVFRLITEHLPDEIYNLAAQSHVGTSFQEPAHTFEATAKGTLNVLEVVRTVKANGHDYAGVTVGGPRVYQASSSEMFGSAWSANYYDEFSREQRADVTDRPPRVGLKHSHPFQDERTPFVPNSPYAVAKLAGHNLVRIYREAYGIHASSGILFNHESERRGANFVTRKISLWAAGLYEAVRKEYPPLSQGSMNFDWTAMDVIQRGLYPRIKLGNLDARRDWGHAEDYVRGMWLMLQQEQPDDYVIATGETHTVREFLEEALSAIGVEGPNADAFVEQDKNLLRPSEVPFLRGDATKAREKLDWRPEVSFKRLVHRMVLSDIGLRLGNGRGCS
jgi:GDPmannose 4,6-dehydratase